MTRTLAIVPPVMLLAAVLCAGCAAHRSSRHQDTLQADSLEQYVAKIRELTARARPAAPKPRPTLESQDRKLAAALLLAATAPGAESLRSVGDEYRRVGVLDMAFRYYNRALRADPADAAAYDGLARIWRDWGFPALGLGDASRAVYYARTSGVSYNTLGTVMQALGNRRGARAAYEQAYRSRRIPRPGSENAVWRWSWILRRSRHTTTWH
jgi:tetratricopeptide (TPR) repeat protein